MTFLNQLTTITQLIQNGTPIYYHPENKVTGSRGSFSHIQSHAARGPQIPLPADKISQLVKDNQSLLNSAEGRAVFSAFTNTLINRIKHLRHNTSGIWSYFRYLFSLNQREFDRNYAAHLESLMPTLADIGKRLSGTNGSQPTHVPTAPHVPAQTTVQNGNVPPAPTFVPHQTQNGNIPPAPQNGNVPPPPPPPQNGNVPPPTPTPTPQSVNVPPPPPPPQNGNVLPPTQNGNIPPPSQNGNVLPQSQNGTVPPQNQNGHVSLDPNSSGQQSQGSSGHNQQTPTSPPKPSGVGGMIQRVLPFDLGQTIRNAQVGGTPRPNLQPAPTPTPRTDSTIGQRINQFHTTQNHDNSPTPKASSTREFGEQDEKKRLSPYDEALEKHKDGVKKLAEDIEKLKSKSMNQVELFCLKKLEIKLKGMATLGDLEAHNALKKDERDYNLIKAACSRHSEMVKNQDNELKDLLIMLDKVIKTQENKLPVEPRKPIEVKPDDIKPNPGEPNYKFTIRKANAMTDFKNATVKYAQELIAYKSNKTKPENKDIEVLIESLKKEIQEIEHLRTNNQLTIKNWEDEISKFDEAERKKNLPKQETIVPSQQVTNVQTQNRDSVPATPRVEINPQDFKRLSLRFDGLSKLHESSDGEDTDED